MNTAFTTAAQNTFAVYKQLGVLDGCKSMGSNYCRFRKVWVVTAKFQDAKGIRISEVAKFDAVEDAVDFKALAGF